MKLSECIGAGRSPSARRRPNAIIARETFLSLHRFSLNLGRSPRDYLRTFSKIANPSAKFSLSGAFSGTYKENGTQSRRNWSSASWRRNYGENRLASRGKQCSCQPVFSGGNGVHEYLVFPQPLGTRAIGLSFAEEEAEEEASEDQDGWHSHGF